MGKGRMPACMRAVARGRIRHALRRQARGPAEVLRKPPSTGAGLFTGAGPASLTPRIRDAYPSSCEASENPSRGVGAGLCVGGMLLRQHPPRKDVHGAVRFVAEGAVARDRESRVGLALHLQGWPRRNHLWQVTVPAQILLFGPVGESGAAKPSLFLLLWAGWPNPPFFFFFGRGGKRWCVPNSCLPGGVTGGGRTGHPKHFILFWSG
mmetsp:Transcript_19413/g.61047  ORF Transcript_19413/g.61047 Transcript_19413/m.61047 type:complete len:208 (+) Transcript_19413:1906-2529(+)